MLQNHIIDCSELTAVSLRVLKIVLNSVPEALQFSIQSIPSKLKECFKVDYWKLREQTQSLFEQFVEKLRRHSSIPRTEKWPPLAESA